jgi:hypothetical protein
MSRSATFPGQSTAAKHIRRRHRRPTILESRHHLTAVWPAWVEMIPEGGRARLAAANALDLGPESSGA